MSILAPSILPPTLHNTSPVANGVAITRDALAFYTRLVREAGNLSHYVLGDRAIFLVNDPRLVREILILHDTEFLKWAFNDSFQLIFGTGLIGSQGEVHDTSRKVANPPLQQSRIPHYVETAIEVIQERLDQWRPGEIDFSQEAAAITLEVLARALFGTSLGAQSDQVFEASKALLRLSTKIGSTPQESAAFDKANTDITAITQGLIDQAKQGNPDSLILALLEAEQSGVISADQLHQEMRTFLLAGYITTAISLSAAFWLLARDQAAQEKLHQEVDQVLGSRLPTIDCLRQLPFCEMVMLEALRLYPPVWVFGRQALRSFELDGYTLPKGGELVICAWLLHRDDQSFPDPESFRPERWQNDARSRLPRCVYLPFSTGARNCIGEHFAMMESILVLASAVQKWKFRELPGQPDPGWSPQLLYWPRRGIRLEVEPRTSQ